MKKSIFACITHIYMYVFLHVYIHNESKKAEMKLILLKKNKIIYFSNQQVPCNY